MLSRRTTTPQQLQRLDEAIRALLQSPVYGQIWLATAIRCSNADKKGPEGPFSVL